jgi:hypothetical protein
MKQGKIIQIEDKEAVKKVEDELKKERQSIKRKLEQEKADIES